MDGHAYYENSYRQEGFAAQRRYPNEELLRFMGRHFFGKRRGRILEVGCGSGANLWMIAREGCEAHGLDFSAEGLALCRKMLAQWNVTATLHLGDMTKMPLADSAFDAVVDVFSSYCLPERAFAAYLAEAARVLAPGGLYFSYTPSKASDAFRDHAPATLLDASTLDGVKRPTSPFFGNDYPVRFIAPEEYAAALGKVGLRVTYSETVGRTYRSGAEYFEFVVVTAAKA